MTLAMSHPPRRRGWHVAGFVAGSASRRVMQQLCAPWSAPHWAIVPALPLGEAVGCGDWCGAGHVALPSRPLSFAIHSMTPAPLSNIRESTDFLLLAQRSQRVRLSIRLETSVASA